MSSSAAPVNSTPKNAHSGKPATPGAPNNPSLESMEKLDDEVDIDGDDEEGSNEGDDEGVTIKDADSSAIENFYRVEGQGDYFHFGLEPLLSLKDNGVTKTYNDWYLKGVLPNAFFGKSQAFLETKFGSYEIQSAYRKADHTYAPFVEAHRPLHGMTEGGKGITMYTRPVIYLTADMSTINNVNITFGCPSNCSFCKESILARGYTQLSVDESTGVVKVELDGHDPFDVPSKAKVKFYDTALEQIIYGPLSVAVINQFPIATDSLDKLRSGDLIRLLND